MKEGVYAIRAAGKSTVKIRYYVFSYFFKFPLFDSEYIKS